MVVMSKKLKLLHLGTAIAAMVYFSIHFIGMAGLPDGVSKLDFPLFDDTADTNVNDYNFLLWLLV
jgi:hypothetical protein